MGSAIFQCLVLLGVGAVIGFGVYMAMKMRKAAAAPIDDDSCVSCGSTNLTMLGNNAYRCQDCGYEGGSGMQALRDEALDDKIAKMSPAQRRLSALSDLNEAKTILIGVEGQLGNIVTATDKAALLNSASAELMRAKLHLEGAIKKAGDDFPSLALPDISLVDDTFGAGEALVGKMAAGAVAIGNLDKASKLGKDLLGKTEGALVELRAVIEANRQPDAEPEAPKADPEAAIEGIFDTGNDS